VANNNPMSGYDEYGLASKAMHKVSADVRKLESIGVGCVI